MPPIIAHTKVKILNLAIISANLHIMTKIYDIEMQGNLEQLGLIIRDYIKCTRIHIDQLGQCIYSFVQG